MRALPTCGTALLHKGRISEGEQVLNPILQNPNTPEAQFVLGMTAFASGNYPEAVTHLGHAAELNATLPQLQSFYGRALLNTGDAVGAEAAFRRELGGNPNDYWANLSLGQILVFRKKFAEGAPLLEHACALRPASPDAALAYAQALLGESRYDKARPYAESAVRDLPDSPKAHRTLEKVYSGLHLKTEAAAQERKASIVENAAANERPRVHDTAPDFELPKTGSGSVRLSEYRGKSPVVLVFGSYSCPNFRGASEALKAMGQRYGTTVPFLLVYIHEAHATDQWQSTRNQREHIELAPAKSMAEKQEHAALCSRKLHLPFPAVVDGMDGAVETAYHAWPSRALIVGSDGRVLYNSRLSEARISSGRDGSDPGQTEWRQESNSETQSPMKLTRREWLTLTALLSASRPLSAFDASAAPLFTEVPAGTSGITWTHDNAGSPEHYLPETLGPGCAFLDYDNDGWMDIYLVNSGPCDFWKPSKPIRNALYKNNRDGTFTDVTEKAGVCGGTFGMGVAVGDYDNDGWPDMFVTAYGKCILYKNNHDGTFTDVTEKSGLATARLDHQRGLVRLRQRRPARPLRLQLCRLFGVSINSNVATTSSVRSIYCIPRVFKGTASFLYHNNGDGTFTDVTKGTDIAKSPGQGLGRRGNRHQQ